MMNPIGWKRSSILAISLAALLICAVPATRAQDAPPQDGSLDEAQPYDMQNDLQNDGQYDGQNKDAQDPPSRVARVSFLSGAVSMQPGGTGDWGGASINRPVTIGDKLWTDQNSRLELQAGQASIHLGSMTALSFLNLDGNATQMRLAEGQMNFRVREIRTGDLYEVDTPNMAFTVREAGAFRIDVNENGDVTGVTVIRGEGEVAAAGQTYTVHAGERATVSGLDNSAEYRVIAAPLNPDELDRWAEQRDVREENSKSAKYVSRDVVGYSDLDDYGDWSEEPTYGHVWHPREVADDWAPYSNGYWSYVGPWGWTWVDYSPWGFAPFHYGRWVYGGGRWGWCPGPIYGGAVYGPAFVGFLGGFNGGYGFGVGIGVGWFPLGWGEPYRPWYHCGNGYWNRINVHNTYIRNANINRTTINNYNYAYARNTRAVTVASRNDFANGRAIQRNNMRVNEGTLRGARVTNGVDARPTHASYFGANNMHGRVATPSSNIQNRQVVARTAPAAGAAHMPVRTMNTSALRPGQYTRPAMANNGRGMSSPSGTMQGNRPGGFGGSTTRSNNSRQANENRPPSARTQGGFGGNARNNPSASGGNASRPNTSPTRTWNAQGNVTDSGRGPQGYGGNRPTAPARTTGMNQGNRPPTYSPGNSSGGYRGNARMGTESQGGSRGPVNRPPAYSNDNRSYRPPSTNENNRGYTAPRSYNPPQNRSYSPPPSYNGNRGSSAPRSYSPPPTPRSYGGGGGNSHPSGGGGSRSSSGGGSHPSGGGGSRSHR